jgi:hypothetical protein
LGANYAVTQHYVIGAALRNLNQPDLALAGASDPVPAVLVAALSRRTREASVSLQVTNTKISGQLDHRAAMGGERWFFNGMGLRAGIGYGSRSFSSLALGMSYRMAALQMDYAFNFPFGGIESAGSHMVSAAFRFGKPPMDTLEKAVDQEIRAREKAELEAADLRKKIEELMGKSLAESTISLSTEPARVPGEAPKKRESPSGLSVNAVLAYTESLKSYAVQVKQGAPVQERITTLRQILERYGNKGINTSAVQSELSRLEDENRRVGEDFKLASGYYKKIVLSGTKPEERIILLERIIKKYKPFGVNTAELERELESLRK